MKAQELRRKGGLADILRHLVSRRDGSEALRDGDEVLDETVFAPMQDVVVAGLTAMVSGVGPAESDDGADAIARSSLGGRRGSVDGVAVMKRHVARLCLEVRARQR